MADEGTQTAGTEPTVAVGGAGDGAAGTGAAATATEPSTTTSTTGSGGGDAGKPTEWTPPSKDEWERTVSGLRDASSESKARKLKLREMEEKLAALEAQTATAEERAARELETRIRTETEGAWRPKVVAAEARAALVAAGCRDHRRFARLIDLAKVEIDSDGEITGIEEQVTELKETFPEGFKKERQSSGQREGGPQAAAQPGSTQAPPSAKTATERQAAMLAGRY